MPLAVKVWPFTETGPPENSLNTFFFPCLQFSTTFYLWWCFHPLPVCSVTKCVPGFFSLMHHSQQSLNSSGHFLSEFPSIHQLLFGGHSWWQTPLSFQDSEMIIIFVVSECSLSRFSSHFSLYFLVFHSVFNSLSVYITVWIACPYTLQV